MIDVINYETVTLGDCTDLFENKGKTVVLNDGKIRGFKKVLKKKSLNGKAYPVLNNDQISVSGFVLEEPVFSHETHGEKFYEFNLESMRVSGTVDIIPCVISEVYVPESGEYIKITGEVRTRNHHRKTIVSVFVRDIETCRPLKKSDGNSVLLSGTICKPPIYRKTPLGREITDIVVAVNVAYRKSYYIPCIAWGRNAFRVGEYEVGDKVTLRGRFQSRYYVKKIASGAEIEKIAYEISCSEIEKGWCED